MSESQPFFVQTNENMELTNAIQSELHVKKELARRMGELQEELHNIKEQVEFYMWNYKWNPRHTETCLSLIW